VAPSALHANRFTTGTRVLHECSRALVLQGEDGDDTNMVAEILLQFKDNLSVHPGKRYTTRTVTGAQPCHVEEM
jgi:hypothetical protein